MFLYMWTHICLVKICKHHNLASHIETSSTVLLLLRSCFFPHPLYNLRTFVQLRPYFSTNFNVKGNIPGKCNGDYPKFPLRMQTLHMLWLARGISSDQHPTQHRAQTRTPTQDNRFSLLLVLILIPVKQDFTISSHVAAVLTGSF